MAAVLTTPGRGAAKMWHGPLTCDNSRAYAVEGWGSWDFESSLVTTDRCQVLLIALSFESAISNTWHLIR